MDNLEAAAPPPSLNELVATPAAAPGTDQSALTPDDLHRARELHSLHLRAEEAQEARLELGRQLIRVRPRWRKSGRGARGWQAFLDAAGIEKRSAQRYMAAAKRVDAIRDKVSRKEKPALVERVLKLVDRLDEGGRKQVLTKLGALSEPTASGDGKLPSAIHHLTLAVEALKSDGVREVETALLTSLLARQKSLSEVVGQYKRTR